MTLNFNLSANAPIMMPGVMHANVFWKQNHRGSGMVPSTEEAVTPCRNDLPAHRGQPSVSKT
eukprot:scaffold771_cov387-Prasinococcus_capsulatus_cf.AAC.5